MDKHPGGRPEHQVTDESKELVRDAISTGKTQEDISEYLDIDLKTLRKHYRDEIAKAKFDMDRQMYRNLAELAFHSDDPNVRTKNTHFYLARRAGWSEAQQEKAQTTIIVHGGLPDGPQVHVKKDITE